MPDWLPVTFATMAVTWIRKLLFAEEPSGGRYVSPKANVHVPPPEPTGDVLVGLGSVPPKSTPRRPLLPAAVAMTEDPAAFRPAGRVSITVRPRVVPSGSVTTRSKVVTAPTAALAGIGPSLEMDGTATVVEIDDVE